MPYEQQLLHKRKTLELAFQRYSRLSAEVIPPIQPTIPSPKRWGYRTKITPHFDMPRWVQRGIAENDPTVKRDGLVWTGMFEQKGKKNEEDEMNGLRERRWELKIGYESVKSGMIDIEVGWTFWQS